MVACRAHNPEVDGSSPSPATIWPYRQAVKSPSFHGGFVGSNPARVTILELMLIS